MALDLALDLAFTSNLRMSVRTPTVWHSIVFLGEADKSCLSLAEAFVQPKLNRSLTVFVSVPHRFSFSFFFFVFLFPFVVVSVRLLVFRVFGSLVSSLLAVRGAFVGSSRLPFTSNSLAVLPLVYPH